MLVNTVNFFLHYLLIVSHKEHTPDDFSCFNTTWFKLVFMIVERATPS